MILRTRGGFAHPNQSSQNLFFIAAGLLTPFMSIKENILDEEDQGPVKNGMDLPNITQEFLQSYGTNLDLVTHRAVGTPCPHNTCCLCSPQHVLSGRDAAGKVYTSLKYV